MKETSKAYQTSMSAILRNQSFARVLFTDIDTSASTDGKWVTNGEVEISELDTLEYEYDYGLTYATLELNRWVLDGTSQPAPDSGTMWDGYISSQMSGEDGTYTTPATLTREFSTPHTIPGFTLTFDDRINEWPKEVTVEFYLEGTVVATANLSPTGPVAEYRSGIASCDKIVITFGAGLPYRRPRLQETLYGIRLTFENDDLISTKQSHDVDPLSRRLPTETMSFTILDYEHNYDPDNPSGMYAYIDKNAPVNIQYGYTLDSGEVEWLKWDRYILNGKPTVKNNQATFTGTGLIGSLSETFYKSKLGEKTFYDMAEEVLKDAGLTPTGQGGDPWVIDESLKNLTTTAVLPIDTHMNCLQLIAHACCCKLYTDDDNIIHITPFDPNEDTRSGSFTLDFTTITKDSQSITKTDQLKSVSVARYVYTLGSDTETQLFEGTTTDTNLHVELSGLAQVTSFTVNGGTLESSYIYGRAADLVLSEGEKTVTITGKTLTENSVVTVYPVDTAGEVDKEENPLITNESMAAALANHVTAWLQRRNTYDASYRGNPELETGDIIGLQTSYSKNLDALVLTDEIDFDGSLSGKLKLKALN